MVPFTHVFLSEHRCVRLYVPVAIPVFWSAFFRYAKKLYLVLIHIKER